MSKNLRCIFTSLLVICLIFSSLPVCAFADTEYTVTLMDANDTGYGTVTSNSALTGLKAGDKVELTAVPNQAANVKFKEWVIYKPNSKGELKSKATAGTDYDLVVDDTDPNKATLTVLGTVNLGAKPVFQGPVVGLTRQYTPIGVFENNVYLITVRNGNSNYFDSVEITGWDNLLETDLVAIITLKAAPADDSTDTLRLRVLKTQGGANNQPSILSAGASYEFNGVIDDASTAQQKNNASLKFDEGFDWIEYDFRIKDDATGNTLKNCKVIFKYPGLAAIEAEGGSVKVGETTYTNGQSVNLGTGEKTIEAAPADGYVFAGWEISGAELADAAANPLTFTMPAEATTIKAKFEKAPEYKIGDVDGNGSVNAIDLQILARAIANWAGYAEKIKSQKAADIDGSGFVNAIDLQILARHLANWHGEYDKYFE